MMPGRLTFARAVPPILFFHQIVERPRAGHYFLSQAITPGPFRSAMERLRRRHRVIGLPELERGWNEGRRWVDNAVAVTFDDGFRNTVIAAEILAEMGLTATFFVLSDVVDSDYVPWYMRFAHVLSTRRREQASLDGPGPVDFRSAFSRRRWLIRAKEHFLALAPAERDAALDALADTLDAPPYDPTDVDVQYLRSQDLRRLRDLGMTIGSHGASHDNLARCSPAELERELVASAAALSGWIDAEVPYLSYPDGRYDDRVIAEARRTYRMAFAATPFEAADDGFRVPRRGCGADVVRAVGTRYVFERWMKDAIKTVLAI